MSSLSCVDDISYFFRNATKLNAALNGYHKRAHPLIDGVLKGYHALVQNCLLPFQKIFDLTIHRETNIAGINISHNKLANIFFSRSVNSCVTASISLSFYAAFLFINSTLIKRAEQAQFDFLTGLAKK